MFRFRQIAVLSASIVGVGPFASAEYIGWQFTFDRPGFAQGRYAPAIADGKAHYVVEHGYLGNIRHEFDPLPIADYPWFGIRARDVKGHLFVKFRIDGHWQKRWVVAGWAPRQMQARYVDLREHGEMISGLWLNSQSSIDGAEWFLDWVGVVKSDNPLGVSIVNAGELTRLPDVRNLVVTFENSLDTPVEALCTVQQAGSPPEVHARVPLRLELSQKIQLQVPVPLGPGTRYQLRIVDQQDATVYYDADSIVPPLLKARMVTPSYRHAIYATQRLDAIDLRCDVNAAAPLREDLQLAAVLMRNGEPLQKVNQAVDGTITRLNLPIGDLGVGDYQVVVDLVHASGRLARRRVPLHVYGPHPNEIRIDERLNLLVNGEPFFPCGFYSVPTKYLEHVAKTGMSAVLTYSRNTETLSDYLDAATRAGLKAVVHSPALWFGQDGEARLREAVATLKDHPALLGWYLIDEPNLSRKGTTPADLARLYALMQDLDPYHPTFTVYCRPDEFAAYRDTHDVFMCDPYPVGHRPLTFVAEWTDLAQEAMAGAKPVHIVPQAFGSEDGPQVHWRLPTAAEEICMGYLALVHGAKGLSYYRFDVQRHDQGLADQGRWPWRTIGHLPDMRPKTWAGFEILGPQLKRFGPIFLSPEPDATVAVTPPEPRIHTALREHRGMHYLFAVNPHGRTVDAHVMVTGIPIESAQRLAAGSAGPEADAVTEKSITARQGVFTDRLEAAAVHIYQLE